MHCMRLSVFTDYSLRVLSLSGLSLPSFWLGLLVLMAAVHWFGSIPIYTNEPRGFLAEVGLLAIPAAVVAHWLEGRILSGCRRVDDAVSGLLPRAARGGRHSCPPKRNDPAHECKPTSARAQPPAYSSAKSESCSAAL